MHLGVEGSLSLEVLEATDPLLHPKLSAFQISCKIILFDLIGKCGDG